MPVKEKIKNIRDFINWKHRSHYFYSYCSYLFLIFRFSIYQLYHKKIAVIALIEHIGDIIACEPVITEVKNRHPDLHIIWLTKKDYVSLVKYNPKIDAVFAIYCLSTWIKLKKKLPKSYVYDLHLDQKFCLYCFVPLNKGNINSSVTKDNYFSFGGLVKAFCLQNNLIIHDDTPHLYIPPSFFEISRKIPLGDYIVIHTRSNDSIKEWEDYKWLLVIDYIINNLKLNVIEVGIKSIFSCTSSGYYNFCGKLQLMQTAALIKNATIFIGIESGPAHMANALDTPGIVLMGVYYNIKKYNPYGGNYGRLRKCRLIRNGENVKDIDYDQVIKNIHSLFNDLNTNVK